MFTTANFSLVKCCWFGYKIAPTPHIPRTPWHAPSKHPDPIQNQFQVPLILWLDFPWKKTSFYASNILKWRFIFRSYALPYDSSHIFEAMSFNCIFQDLLTTTSRIPALSFNCLRISVRKGFHRIWSASQQLNQANWLIAMFYHSHLSPCQRNLWEYMLANREACGILFFRKSSWLLDTSASISIFISLEIT